uniref:Uncharacterized protein n=1 Tax=Arundo donax TaxID=35708 RepID=A0A0A9ELA6_ARUDO
MATETLPQTFPALSDVETLKQHAQNGSTLEIARLNKNRASEQRRLPEPDDLRANQVLKWSRRS